MQVATFSNEHKIGYALADRNVELMSIDYASQVLSSLLTPLGLTQQVFILSEEQSTQTGGAIQEIGISKLTGTILLRG
jgi:hypothetical protein